MAERALLTGASSGIGEALAYELAREGAHIALLARRRDRLEAVAREVERLGGRASIYPHDLRKVDEAEALFDQITRDLGGLDLFIGNAGVRCVYEPQEVSVEADREMLETNTVGAIHWTNLAARFFLQIGRGRIIGISSIAGERGRVLNGTYSASKAAYTVYLDSLRYRLTPKGLRISIVKPGFIDTPMLHGQKDLFWVTPADVAARDILRTARAGREVFYVSRRWALLSLVLHLLPSCVLRRLRA